MCQISKGRIYDFVGVSIVCVCVKRPRVQDRETEIHFILSPSFTISPLKYENPVRVTVQFLH